MNMVTGFGNLIAAFLGVPLITTFGRRMNLKYSIYLISVSMYTMGLGVYLNIPMICSFSLMVFIIAYGVGPGGTATVYSAEITPAIGVGVSTAVKWLFVALIGKFLPILNEK